jgi:hypothetical protein
MMALPLTPITHITFRQLLTAHIHGPHGHLSRYHGRSELMCLLEGKLDFGVGWDQMTIYQALARGLVCQNRALGKAFCPHDFGLQQVVWARVLRHVY